MKRFTTWLTLAGVAIALTATMLWPRGRAEFVVSDVTQPIECSVKAPRMPFRNGALSVTIEGQLDGEATLDMISNHGQDKSTETLSGTIQKRTVGGAEAWVDDLVVRFVPGSARQGHVRVVIACGKNPKDTR